MVEKLTQHKKIWTLLQTGEPTTINKISKKLQIPENSIALYIRALYNAKYLSADTPHTKIKHNQKIQLIKTTGPIPPTYNKRGILRDLNTIEEIIITERGVEDVKIKVHKNLLPILTALIKLGKKKVYRAEIWQKAELKSSALSRWTPQLLDAKVLQDTGEKFRGSSLYLVDIEKATLLKKYVQKFKSHKLAFEKLGYNSK